jgi:mycofactocin precursor
MPEETITAPTATNDEPATEQLVAEDLLVEDVSIDGMCGVY